MPASSWARRIISTSGAEEKSGASTLKEKEEEEHEKEMGPSGTMWEAKLKNCRSIELASIFPLVVFARRFAFKRTGFDTTASSGSKCKLSQSKGPIG